jgi:uncharacterized protein YukE
MVAAGGNVFGLDVAAVEDLARVLDEQADAVRRVITTVTTQMDGTEWNGPDATQFQQEWDGTHQTALNNIATALDGYATTARTNATAQENTSNSY